MKGYMYILLCGDGSYYTGSTTNLELRLDEHQKGYGANHTRKHLPVKLLYFEEFSRIDDAFYREKQVQGWSRSKKEALINGDINKLKELSKNSLRQAQGTTSTSKMVPSTSSGTCFTDDSESTRPVAELVEATVLPTTPPMAEPVEAIALTIDSDSTKSVSCRSHCCHF
jgi:putative endonuclease